MSAKDLETRWMGFLGKLDERLAGIVAETDEAVREIAAVDPLDPGPMTGVESALQSRILNLSNKIDEAWESLDNELDALMDDATGRKLTELVALRDKLLGLERGAQRMLHKAEEKTKAHAFGRVGRQLARLAEAEPTTQRCGPCGAVFDPGPLFQSTNVTCTRCGAVSTAGPGPARLQWSSRGVRYIADHKAIDAYLAMVDARETFQALRHPTSEDYTRYEQAYETYYRTLYDAMVAQHPAAWTPERADAEVRGMVGQLRRLEHTPREVSMSQTEEGLRIAAGRNPSAVAKWAATVASDQVRPLLLDNLLEAAVERRARGAAEALVQVVHRDEVPWLFKGRWVKSRLAELSPAFA